MKILHLLKTYLYWVLLLFVIVLVDCTAIIQEGTSTLPSETNATQVVMTQLNITLTSSDVTLAPIASLTPESLSASTNSPTSTLVIATNTPSLIGTPISPTDIPISSPVPTLSVEQEGAFLSALMVSNSDCDSLCWWGIIPGQTSVQAARDLFMSQGVDDWVVSSDSSYVLTGLGYPRSNSSNYHDDVNVKLWIRSDLIQYISVDSDFRNEDLRPTFVRDWQSYSPPELMKQFGVPPFIEFSEIENSPYYRLVLSYEEKGIEVSYFVPFLSLDNGRRQVCFNLEEIDFIFLVVYSPVETGQISAPIIPNRLDNYISWEEATGTDLAAFQQIFQDANQNFCTEIEAN